MSECLSIEEVLKILALEEQQKSRFFALELSQGKIPGYTYITKFGENPEIDTATAPEDIWDYGGIYTWSTTADITQISSSSIADTQPTVVIGLDENWLEVTQTVTLTGQAPATLGTPLIRVYRAYNMGTVDYAGNIYITTTGAALVAGVPTVSTTVRAMIRGVNNQTLMCIYTVPANKIGYALGGYTTMTQSKTSNALITWRARPEGGVFQVKSKIGLVSTGTTNWVLDYPIPFKLPPKTDVLIRCETVSVNDAAIGGGFNIILCEDWV